MARRKGRKYRRNPDDDDWGLYGDLPSGGVSEVQRKLMRRQRRRRKAGKRKAGKSVRRKAHKATKSRRRSWRMTMERNPMGELKTIMTPPIFTEPKGYHRPIFQFLGAGLLGLVDTGLIGMAINYGCCKTEIKDWQKDACRIVGKLGFGTLLSYSVAKATKKTEVTTVRI